MHPTIINRFTAAAALLLAAVSLPNPAAARTDPATRKVAILIFDNVQVIDYSGPLEVLSDAGFDVFTVAATKDPVTTSAGDAVKLTPKYTFDDAPQADLIIIPGGGYEAPKDSAAVAWIKRESVKAEHVMSVCNGAFTLANTGLMDGLSATTTAGNINRLRTSYPAIRVTGDQRIVDNGKILATGGLSAGIDGALHMVDVMKGEGAGQSAALFIEYDRRQNDTYRRGAMADQLVPSIHPSLSALGISEPFDVNYKGDQDSWEKTLWFSAQQSPPEFFAMVKTAYKKAYSLEGPWAPNSLRMEPAGPLASSMRFDDRQGRHWKGTVTVDAVAGEAHQIALRIAIDRIG
jgi:putative intracellular protease/amidase